MKLQAKGKEYELTEEGKARLSLQVEPEELREVIKALMEWPQCRPGYLQAITGVDEADKGVFELYYLWWCHPLKSIVIVRTSVPRDQAEVDTISDIVPAARPYEMEVYDLLGVRFRGNNLLREGFLKPEDLKNTFPLRKR